MNVECVQSVCVRCVCVCVCVCVECMWSECGVRTECVCAKCVCGSVHVYGEEDGRREDEERMKEGRVVERM